MGKAARIKSEAIDITSIALILQRSNTTGRELTSLGDNNPLQLTFSETGTLDLRVPSSRKGSALNDPQYSQNNVAEN